MFLSRQIDPDTSRKKSRRWLIASEQHVCAVAVERYRGSRVAALGRGRDVGDCGGWQQV
ncbi:MAG: hypothetical protein H8E28_02335 [Anaerolineae bacterium]|nr:hypothetical protein [Anaerolineae bacterium]MBL6965155.1 hypothetical protein [Anaerolineales bacterium]